MTDTIITVEVPADVRDNSETVTDYAFMRHRSPGAGVCTASYRDRTIRLAPRLGYQVYTWYATNQGTRDGRGAGQRCRFDMIVNRDCVPVYLFHTEYFTRVACATGDWCHSYASHYAMIVKDGEPTTDAPLPYCDEHMHRIKRAAEEHGGTTVHTSERLYIGQHN